ncbi:hypothetical protein AR543_p0027 (plasmid) [Paenibacillus bovis]|uniref:Antirestriction protein n=1 Tax=Paenibacillus bovis TaxID=1616788 RepID=A0A1X9T3T2_9BACL|nr:hypothetical protein AR543_p0027 [Paenibacillus bovis]
MRKQKTGKTVADVVTERIVELMSRGVIPWRRGWDVLPAVNYVTQKAYKGINLLLLDRAGEYMTYKQMKDHGGTLKKGAEKFIAVQYYEGETKLTEQEQKEGKEATTYRSKRYYSLYHIADIEGIQSKQPHKVRNHQPLETAEKFIQEFANKPVIKVGYNQAVYYTERDLIEIPALSSYQKPEEYYSTAYHELIHATGHSSRLNREGFTDSCSIDQYSKEELIAEIGSAMLCTMAGIEHSTLEDSAAYIQSWASRLKGDSDLIIQAAAKAQAAVSYIAPNYNMMMEEAA